MIFKGDMKKSTWLNSYENWNVDVGLNCGFSVKLKSAKEYGQCQIKCQYDGAKVGHQNLEQIVLGYLSNCGYFTFLHYHKVNVFEEQDKIKSS